MQFCHVANAPFIVVVIRIMFSMFQLINNLMWENENKSKYQANFETSRWWAYTNSRAANVSIDNLSIPKQQFIKHYIFQPKCHWKLALQDI